LQKSTECTDYQGFYTFDESLESTDFKTNCNVSNIYTFSIKARGIGTEGGTFSVGTGENIKNYTVASNKELIENVAGMKLILTKPDGTTKSAEIMNGSVNNEIMMYSGEPKLVLPEPGEIKTYNYTSTDTFVSAEVYPILKSGRICADVEESIEIKSCE
jgi:hypothetical protein